jgi:8-oxo-dGTP diphosphatase
MRVKRSVALAIRSPDGDRILLVRRPADDPELPGVWGLPAASLAEGESWEDAVLRAAHSKLGLEVQVTGVLNRGVQRRPQYTLEMRLYEALITAGEPALTRTDSAVTQYSDWRWATPDELRPAAELGSFCSRLMLTQS